MLLAFTAKYDGIKRAMFLSEWNVTNDLEYDIYSGNIDLGTIRVAFLEEELFALGVISANVESEYLQKLTCEKVYTIAGLVLEQNGKARRLLFRKRYMA